jgi:hypothetical protein
MRLRFQRGKWGVLTAAVRLCCAEAAKFCVVFVFRCEDDCEEMMTAGSGVEREADSSGVFFQEAKTTAAGLGERWGGTAGVGACFVLLGGSGVSFADGVGGDQGWEGAFHCVCYGESRFAV